MRINVFNFKKNWKLVEPHLNDSEVEGLLNKGMLQFSKLPINWNHLPQWDVKNGHGPWEYTKAYIHHGYASDKQGEDPEYSELFHEYNKILESLGVDFTGIVVYDNSLYQGSEDKKVKEVNLKFQEKFERIYSKYLPKRNTYRWYQCYGGCFYLAEWQEALARKVFPKYDWITYQKHNKNKGWYKGGHSTTLGFTSQGNCLIFDILLFETESADEILQAVGLNLNKIEEMAVEFQLMPQIDSIDSSIRSIELNISMLEKNIRNTQRTNRIS
ncbi:hypothetical protein [Desulfatitalea tepidiphila]|uniref:hypothetical protein n=1 Tax=Desulfatitalea tepidiphila TaxID=1185843 RepID=UPI0006B4BC4D|nr:hypothetical protein [Desulfatitalea tepidiphila]